MKTFLKKVLSKNQKGQLFSLDMVLAAVIFTVAVGLILNQSELWVLGSQSQRQNQELQQSLILASNALVSKPELWATPTVPPLTPVNLRCTPDEWQNHNDFSWVENCLAITPPASGSYILPPHELGLPSNYLYQLHSDSPFVLAFIPSGILPIFPTSAPILTLPVDKPVQTIDRNMLVFIQNPSAAQIDGCLKGNCTGFIIPVQISVWRDP